MSPGPVVVRLAERGQDPDGSFRVRVSFGDTAEYDVTVTDPAGQAVEGRLAWYFEQHLRYPFLDKDLEQQAVAADRRVWRGAVRAGVRRSGKS